MQTRKSRRQTGRQIAEFSGKDIGNGIRQGSDNPVERHGESCEITL